uniref:SPK domain-containing protein n=1 Tax=Caenorhabditis japonica TaxID=281687 RepID=A0A8R1DEQ6_CAEJA
MKDKTGSKRSVTALKKRYINVLRRSVHNAPFGPETKLELCMAIRGKIEKSALDRLSRTHEIVVDSGGHVVSFRKRDWFSEPCVDWKDPEKLKNLKLIRKIKKEDAASLKARLAEMMDKCNNKNSKIKEKTKKSDKKTKKKKKNGHEDVTEDVAYSGEEQEEELIVEDDIVATPEAQASMKQFFNSLKGAIFDEAEILVQNAKKERLLREREQQHQQQQQQELADTTPESIPEFIQEVAPTQTFRKSLCIKQEPPSTDFPPDHLPLQIFASELKRAALNLNLNSQVCKIDEMIRKMGDKNVSFEKLRLALETSLAIISPKFTNCSED